MREPTYEPKGLRFYDARSGRDMLLIDDGERYAGWLCYRHPDGQWVTERVATLEDRRALAAASTQIEVTVAGLIFETAADANAHARAVTALCLLVLRYLPDHAGEPFCDALNAVIQTARAAREVAASKAPDAGA